jgi:hypothetical protein
MLNELRKSIQTIVYERISSPFSGAFILSWIVWNWKLLYYLLFSSEKVVERIDYVQSNFINIRTTLLFPLLSTIFLVVLFPFITIGSYWVWLKFKSLQNEIQNQVEKNQLLTIEKSIELRMELCTQNEKYDKLLKSKESDISLLLKENELLKDTINVYEGKNKFQNMDEDSLKMLKKEYDDFERTDWRDSFNKIVESASHSSMIKESDHAPAIINYYLSNEIIQKKPGTKNGFIFTEKGKQFVHWFTNSRYYYPVSGGNF